MPTTLQTEILDDFFTKCYNAISSVDASRDVISIIVFDQAERYAADNKEKLDQCSKGIDWLHDTFMYSLS